MGLLDPPHGLDTDIRPVRNDGAEAATQWNWGSYSRTLTKLLLQVLWDTGMVSRVLFNDPVLIGEGVCQAYSGNDNHLHVDWALKRVIIM